jgi:hypothetical protein
LDYGSGIKNAFEKQAGKSGGNDPGQMTKHQGNPKFPAGQRWHV